MVKQVHTLIIDIGNSNVKYHWLGKTYYLLTDLLQAYQGEACRVYAISVDHKQLDITLAELRAALTIQRIDIFDPQQTQALKNTYPELGADRITKACGALLIFPAQDLILMDFGTATTLTICTKDFSFVRGLIHLGLQSYLNAMKVQCPSLSKFITNDLLTVNYTQSSTQQAIVEAAYREHFALVADDLAYAHKILAYNNYVTIATGGLGEIFADKFDKYIDSRILLESYVTNNLSIPL